MQSIKILKASNYYPDIISSLYDNEIDLKLKSYSHQYDKIMKIHFSWSDIWKRNLENISNYKVEEIIINNEFLQKKWAEENFAFYDENNWKLEILEAQCMAFNPTIFFAHDYSTINSDFLLKIKRKCKSIKLIISYDGMGICNTDVFRECDLILSCIPAVCEFYIKKGFLSYYMHFPFENTILTKILLNRSIHDFSFIGSIMKGNGIHDTRISQVNKLVTKTPLKVWAPGILENGKFYKTPQRKRLLKRNFYEFWSTYKLAKSYQGSAYGLEMYQILSDSKITFNSHGDFIPKYAGNMRLWEATGLGTCLVTDWKENMCSLFKQDIEVVTYRDIDDCIDKVKFLLRNDNVRTSIAIAGQKRTLECYSSQVIFSEFDRYLRGIL